ncbi:MAG: hypothetical protein KIS76_19095, partial [Pyrinomonadaceae bacterium]|nr:hypothetical protein [Pyrinomonadaceae bacterium]
VKDSSNDRDKIAVLKGSLEFQGTIIADGEVNALGDIIFYIGSAELDEGKLQEFYSGADVFKVTLTVEVPKDTAELYPTGDQERIGDNHSYARPTGSGEASKNNNIDVGSKPTLGMSGRTNEPSNINKLTISEPVNGIVTVSFIAHFKSNKENNFNSVHVNIAGERSKGEFFNGSFKVVIEPKSKTQNVDHLLKKKP